MATSFPSALDSFTNPSASDALDSVTVGHASQHANINDAMEAVQAKLGTGAGTIGEWITFAPSLRFGANTITPGASFGRYTVLNDIVIVSVYAIALTFTGTGTLYFDLPTGATIDMPENYPRVGYGQVYDSSTGAAYVTSPLMQFSSISEVRFNLDGVVGSVSDARPFTFTSGSDEIHFTLIGIKA